MSGKFLLLLTLFVILLCACIGVLLTANNPSWFDGQNAGVFLGKTSSPSPVVSNTLSITSTNQTITPGQTNTLRVIIDSQDAFSDTRQQIIQIELSYDPKALTNVTMSPGDFFQQSTVTLNIIDPNTGRISYALEGTDEPMQHTTGIVAIITFTPNPAFSGKETDVTFLPKTTIRTTGSENRLTTTYGTKLFLSKEK